MSGGANCEDAPVGAVEAAAEDVAAADDNDVLTAADKEAGTATGGLVLSFSVDWPLLRPKRVANLLQLEVALAGSAGLVSAPADESDNEVGG